MTKDTIIKAFERQFPFKIWKIVTDAARKHIGLEVRDSESTKAILYVINFEGEMLVDGLALSEKEWTLESVQHQRIILKRVGERKPVVEGIKLLDFEGEECFISYEHVLLDTFLGYLKVRHRSFESGMEEYIALSSGTKVVDNTAIRLAYCEQIKLPTHYTGELPPYLSDVKMEDAPWVSIIEDRVIWSYHDKDERGYNLSVCLADKFKPLAKLRIFSGMDKMIPQPYFQIGDQIFLMSYNKQEIVSYLV